MHSYWMGFEWLSQTIKSGYHQQLNFENIQIKKKLNAS